MVPYLYSAAGPVPVDLLQPCAVVGVPHHGVTVRRQVHAADPQLRGGPHVDLLYLGKSGGALDLKIEESIRNKSNNI